MNLNQPAARSRPPFCDDEPVLQSHPLLADALGGTTPMPQFNDRAVWDFNDVVLRPANLAPCQWRVRFSGELTDPAWNLLAREVLIALANPRHEALHDVGVHLGDDRANVRTRIQTASQLRRLAAWARNAGLPAWPGQWTHRNLDQRIKDLKEVRKPAGVASTVSFLMRMAVLGPALSGGWPGGGPWEGRSAPSVANCPGSHELSTEAIKPEIWFPLIRAAWAYVHAFAPDILRATRRLAELRQRAAPSIIGREDDVAARLTDPARNIPVYSNKMLKDGGARVHWRLMDLSSAFPDGPPLPWPAPRSCPPGPASRR